MTGIPVSYTHLDVYKRQVWDSELQVLWMARHQNNVDALVHALQFEAVKSASGWENHKVHWLKDRDGLDNEEEEQGTETQWSAPQNKVRKDGRPKCHRCGKPGPVSYTHLDVYKRQL